MKENDLIATYTSSVVLPLDTNACEKADKSILTIENDDAPNKSSPMHVKQKITQNPHANKNEKSSVVLELLEDDEGDEPDEGIVRSRMKEDLWHMFKALPVEKKVQSSQLLCG